ncbi:MAG: class I SAM-dependent methyltransferase [Rhodoferax sp.]
MARRTLIFPAGMPRSLAFLERAQSEGKSVIGSSSLGHDPVRELYPEWVRLPYVTSADFDQALRQAIVEYAIDGIFTPNPVVWDYLNRKLSLSFPGMTLVNGSPVDAELAPYRNALQFGQSVKTQPLTIASSVPPHPPVSVVEISSLFHHANAIPGMCDHEKIRALCEVFRYAPAGDVVEIGSWWGKSAFVLLRLAQCYGVGKLLCIDPWMNEHLVQNDEKGLVDLVPLDADEAFTVFQLNLLPYANGALNYLRQPSVEAAIEYHRRPIVMTPTFGETTYTNRIAVLHVDGNHSYGNASSDLAAWAEFVIPGGWIVIDDYLWPYGDGPQRAANELLFEQTGNIDTAFVMGGALFMQLS